MLEILYVPSRPLSSPRTTFLRSLRPLFIHPHWFIFDSRRVSDIYVFAQLEPQRFKAINNRGRFLQPNSKIILHPYSRESEHGRGNPKITPRIEQKRDEDCTGGWC